MAGFLSLLRRIYLSVYNWTVFVGWFQVLYLAVKTVRESGHQHVYSAVERPLQLAQTAAILEVLFYYFNYYFPNSNSLRFTHFWSGEISSISNIATDSFKVVFDLVHLVEFPSDSDSHTCDLPSHQLVHHGGKCYMIFSFIPTAFLGSCFVLFLCMCQTVTNKRISGKVIIRYSFFGLKEALGFAPSWLLWLRYSTFLLLYPTGITSEVGLIYVALPFIKESEKYCIRMPNKWNFSFDFFYAAILVLGIYAVLTCMGICLDKGRKLSQSPRRSRMAESSFNVLVGVKWNSIYKNAVFS
uniref:Very-long-chain (3R)-3-hydroxyacyl-CoA dehydratase n=1 Tax=Quercus lobata TaxID=97700 RepID=A0A7N2LZ21_QUELO